MTLLQPDTGRIGRPPGAPAEDRFSDETASGTPQALREALSELIGPEQVLHRVIDLVRYASDASPYRFIPQVVVTPRTTVDVVAVLNYCRENGCHASFRAGGTSLCGQAHANAYLRRNGRRLGPVSATRDEKAYLDEHPAEVYLSANRTCEMGLQQTTGKPYESSVFVLEQLTRPSG